MTDHQPPDLNPTLTATIHAHRLLDEMLAQPTQPAYAAGALGLSENLGPVDERTAEWILDGHALPPWPTWIGMALAGVLIVGAAVGVTAAAVAVLEAVIR